MTTTIQVATKLVEAIALSYPALRDAYRGVASRILESAETACIEAVDKVLAREKDPFTVTAGIRIVALGTLPCLYLRFARAFQLRFSRRLLFFSSVVCLSPSCNPILWLFGCR